jgi:hypothetical protein
MNILDTLTQLHYYAVGEVLYDYGYDVKLGEAIYPDQIVQAVEENGVDFAADLAAKVTERNGTVTTTQIMEAVKSYVPSADDFTGFVIDLSALGWLVAFVLLVILLSRR